MAGAIAEAVIDIAVVVDVPGAAALAMLDVNRTVIAPIAEGRGHPERQALQGLLEVGVGFRQVPCIARKVMSGFLC